MKREICKRIVRRGNEFPICGEPGTWEDPEGWGWFCEEHAKDLRGTKSMSVEDALKDPNLRKQIQEIATITDTNSDFIN